MQRDSIGQILKVAISLCIVCSVLVSAAAVLLRPAQQENKQLEIHRNILIAAGITAENNNEVAEVFKKRVVRKYVRLEDGTAYDLDENESELESLLGTDRVDQYDPRKAAKDPALSKKIAEENDIAKIRRRERIAVVYLVYDESGKQSGRLEKIVLPVYGKGLWSTLYGFAALEVDPATETLTGRIRGLTFYEHGETPGLGGEVDNPAWKKQWRDKRGFDEDGDVVVNVIKGNVNPDDPNADRKVDGLAGATITSRGVENLLHYWLGPDGFGPFLDRYRD